MCPPAGETGAGAWPRTGERSSRRSWGRQGAGAARSAWQSCRFDVVPDYAGRSPDRPSMRSDSEPLRMDGWRVIRHYVNPEGRRRRVGGRRWRSATGRNLRCDGGGIGGVTLTLEPSEARTHTAAEIEGSAEVTPQGKWRGVTLSTGLVTAWTGIWSRPTALYAPTTTEQPLVVPLTNQSQAAPIRQREAEYAAQSTAETDEAILERYAEALGATLAGTQSPAMERQQGLHGGHITPPADLVEALRTDFD